MNHQLNLGSQRIKRSIEFVASSNFDDEFPSKRVLLTSDKNDLLSLSSSTTMEIDGSLSLKISITTFEDLSNDIFYEISDYLGAYELFEAFNGLNQRYNDLLNSSSLLLKTSSSDLYSDHASIHYVQSFIIPNRHRFVSINLNDEVFTNFHFPTISIDGFFTRLQYLSLYDMSTPNVLVLLSSLVTVPTLHSLDIRLNNDRGFINLILKLVAQLPAVRHHRLLSPRILAPVLGPLESTLPTFTCDSMESLTLDLFWTFRRLLQILRFFPGLARLNCRKVAENLLLSDAHIASMSNLKTLIIHDCRMIFDVFEFYLTKICRSIQSLRLETSWQIAYMNADRWEQLIRKHMPNLRTLSLKYREPIYSNHMSRPEHALLGRFSSKFWIDRRLMLEMKIDFSHTLPISICYSITPYKEIWYETINVESNPFKNTTSIFTDQACNHSYCRLHLTENQAMFYSDAQDAIAFVHSMLELTPITDLCIDFSVFSISTIMTYVALLPSLNSLSIISRMPEAEKNLSEEYFNKLDQHGENNRITKVNLEVMTEIDQIDLLMHLCPKMTHLQVTCRTMNDAIWLIRYVSSQLAKKLLVPDLRCLCLRQSQSDEQMVKILQATIQEMKLFINFTIDRICDRIFIFWY